MSIRDEVDRRCEEGRLLAVYPRARWAPVRRMLYVSEELHDLLTQSWPDPGASQRWAQLEASLSHFVEGGVIDDKYMRPLERPARYVWEIRSRRPKPSIRVFGRFAEVDVFIATNAAYRKPLGGKGSRAWRDEIVGCTTIWRQLFPAHQPIESDDVHDCVSENAYTAAELGR
jgi:hypothetical protein